jgi:hypothetical protein
VKRPRRSNADSSDHRNTRGCEELRWQGGVVRDPELPLADVQWVLGHASLSTTQIYTVAAQEEVIADLLGHHACRASTPAVPAPPAPGYDLASLGVLFGELP